MRRAYIALTALAVLAAPSAFAADAMMKPAEPAMMEKTPDAMMKKPDAMMAKPAFTPYVQARLDALVEKIATGSKKDANVAWIKSAMGKVAPGSRAAAIYAYLLEQIAWYGQDSMMKPDEDAMMKSETGAMMKKPDAMMKSGTGAMMAAGTYADYSADAVKAAQESGKTPVLFFAASWCPNCRALDAAIRAHAGDIPSSVAVFKVDYDDSADLKTQYGVRMQHTLVALRADGTSVLSTTVTDVAGVAALAGAK